MDGDIANMMRVYGLNVAGYKQQDMKANRR